MLFSKDNPARPPNWRWKKAAWMREKGKYLRKEVDDADTEVLRKYQLLKSRCLTDIGNYNLSIKFPGIYWAEHVRDNVETLRYTLEARLLANEPLESIAHKTGCTLDTVIWFEKAFFDVLEYLDRQDYITNIVMGESVHRGMNAREFDLLWKLIGYCSGSILLDAYILPFSRSIVTSADQVPARQAELIKQTLARKAVMASATMSVAYKESAILEFYTRQLEIEKEAGVGSESSTIVNNISCSLKHLGTQFSLERDKGVASQLEYYDKSSAELRAGEMLLVSAGKEDPGYRDLVNLKFPEGGKDVQGTAANK